MSLRYYHLERQQSIDTVAPHAFVLNGRLQAPVNRAKCAACGRHALNRSAHERLSQEELDEISIEKGALWYPSETRAQALRSLGLSRGRDAQGSEIWE